MTGLRWLRHFLQSGAVAGGDRERCRAERDRRARRRVADAVRRTIGRDWQKAHVIALSRSGETTETVAAAKASRAAGAYVTAITMEPGSALASNCDRLVAAETHPLEGIVMTTSASLMLLLGIAAHRSCRAAVADRRRERLARQGRRKASRPDREPVALRLSRWRTSLWGRARGCAQADGNEPDLHTGLPPARIPPRPDQPCRRTDGGRDALQCRSAGRGEPPSCANCRTRARG